MIASRRGQCCLGRGDPRFGQEEVSVHGHGIVDALSAVTQH